MANTDDATLNAMINTVETTWGSDPYAKVFTGSMPANIGDPDSGTALSGNIVLPGGANFLTAGSGGVAQTAAVDFTLTNNGTPGYVRWYSSDGTKRTQRAVGAGITVTPLGALVSGAPARLGVLNFRVQ